LLAKAAPDKKSLKKASKLPLTLVRPELVTFSKKRPLTAWLYISL